MTLEQLQKATTLLENVKDAQLNKQFIEEARNTLPDSVAGIFVNSNTEEELQHTIILPTEIVATLLDIAEQYYNGLEEQCTKDFGDL